MAQLVFIDGRNMGNVVALQAMNTLGHSRENSIVLSDSTILERHAVIQYRDGMYRIMTCNGGSRVSVNGRDVRSEGLRHGDIISIGDVTILFSDEGPATPQPAPKADLPGDLTDSVVQSRMRSYESAEEVITTLRSHETLSGHLETLYRISAALSATLRLEEVVEQLLTILMEVLKPDRAFLLLYDERGTLRVQGERVGEKSRLTGFVRVSRTILNEALERREAILTKDAASDERFTLRQSIVEQNIQSALCVPMVKKDRILGLLYLDTVTPLKTYTDDDLHLINGISAQAAMAIENVLHYNRSVEYSRRLSMLGETSRRISSFLSRDVIVREAVEAVGRLLGCKKTSVLLAEGEVLRVCGSSGIDPKMWDSIRVRSGEGFCGKVLSENKPMLVADTTQVPGTRQRPYESSSFLIVPIVARAEGIRSDSRPIGVITATDKTTRGIFTMDDQEFLSVFAAAIGIALQNATLFEKTTVDSLTRLYTRQYFFARAEEILEEHRAQKAPTSLLMCDLDHFKEKNDRFGHQTGDEILSQVGRLVKELLPSALNARYGGEELVVLLPGVPLPGAIGTAEELRQAFEACDFGGEEPIRCTVSIGVAEATANDTLETLLRKADHALFRAKAAGRNQALSFDGTEPPPATKSGVLRLGLPQAKVT